MPLRARLAVALRISSAIVLLSCSATDSTNPGGGGSTPVAVATINVGLPRAVIHVGDSVQASATLLSATSSVLTGRAITWSTDKPSVATVSQSGLVKSAGLGTAVISASSEGVTGQATLSVTVVPIGSITFLPDTGSVLVGRAMVLPVIVKDSLGVTVGGRTLTWSSSDTIKARVSSDGVITGLSAGTVDIIAAAEGKTGVTHIKILPVVTNTAVASVSISIPRTAFRAGESLQAAAFPLDSSGGVLTGRTVAWSSSNPDIASVTSGGLVTGLAAGTATIQADVEGKSGKVAVQISLVPVATVTVTPATETVSSGATVALGAILKDSAGRTLTGRSVSWTSAQPTIASVSDVGVVTGILVGASDIVATSEGKQGHATISVNTLNTAVATITVTPANVNMSGGGTKQFTAVLRDANGNILGGRTVTWSSSNPDRATVSASGLVTASAVDAPVVITALAEGKSATASIGISTFIRLSAGAGFACGLTSDGTAYCWGTNDRGQVGDGTTSMRLTPTKVATDAKFVAINSGSTHTCALTVAGAAYCWGANDLRQTGATPAATVQSTPFAVGGGYRFVSVAAGIGSTCATTAEGDVDCWGSIRATDPFGDALTFQVTETPVKIGGGMVAVVSGLDGQYCTVDQTGLGYCWALIYFYPQAGPVVPPIGAPVSTTLHFATLRRGLEHTCGITTSGQTYCWGRNDYGQLGDGTTTNRTSPTLVAGGLVFESLAAGGAGLTDDIAQTSSTAGFSCGLVSGGKAYCWGANNQGQLGLGSQSASVTTPQAVSGGVSFTGIRGGSNFICGLAVGGAGFCWGSNATGQFGDGSTTLSTKPTQIFGN